MTPKNVGSEGYTPTTPVRRSSDGVVVQDLEVSSDGDRSCYHFYDATVINDNQFPVENVVITITVYNERGQSLSTFETSFRELSAGQEVEMEVNHGPQKNECWFQAEADDYEVTVSYDEI